MKKTNCTKCNSKTAVFDLNSNNYKCHICGTKFEEKKQTLIGNFTYETGQDNQFKRYITFNIPKEHCKIEEKDGKMSITIFEIL
jgi:DNA-directed RNA polymerase subunit RPC12/RpoP